jgi:hypothetical protein
MKVQSMPDCSMASSTARCWRAIGLCSASALTTAADDSLLHREIEPVLAAEVVSHEILADARPPGDVAHPRAREALGGELLQRGVQQRGIAHPRH